MPKTVYCDHENKYKKVHSHAKYCCNAAKQHAYRQRKAEQNAKQPTVL